MSTGAIIAIVVGALILLALLWFVARAGRERRLDTRRDEAREIRREAEVGSAQADKSRAEADAQAARPAARTRWRASARRPRTTSTVRRASATSRRRRRTRRRSGRGRGRVRPAPRGDRGRDRHGHRRHDRHDRRRRPERRALRADERLGRGARAALRARLRRRSRTRRDVRAAPPEQLAARTDGGGGRATSRARLTPSCDTAFLRLLAADRPVAAAVLRQEEPGPPGLLRARSRGGVSPSADDAPGAEAELVQAAVCPAATDGTRVVARLAPRDRGELLLAPPRDVADPEAVDRRPALVRLGPGARTGASSAESNDAAHERWARGCRLRRPGRDSARARRRSDAASDASGGSAPVGEYRPPWPCGPEAEVLSGSYQPALCSYQPATA